MHLAERATETSPCKLKVLDLGVMITDEDWQQSNTNDAVQAFRKRGETEEKRRRYDWLPWEVRIAADGIGPPLNFEKPVHSFDMFSLGVLALHLTIGRTEARIRLGEMERAGAGKDLNVVEVIDTNMLGLDPSVHRLMLGPAATRPTPSDVVKSIEAKLAEPQKLPSVSRYAGGFTPAQRSSGHALPEVTLSRTRSPTIWQEPPEEEKTREPILSPPALRQQPPEPEKNGKLLFPPKDAVAPGAPNGHCQPSANVAALPRDPLRGASAKAAARLPRQSGDDSCSASYEYSISDDSREPLPGHGNKDQRERSRRHDNGFSREKPVGRPYDLQTKVSRSLSRSRSPKAFEMPRSPPADREHGPGLFGVLQRCRSSFGEWGRQASLPQERSRHWLLRFPLKEPAPRRQGEG